MDLIARILFGTPCPPDAPDPPAVAAFKAACVAARDTLGRKQPGQQTANVALQASADVVPGIG